LRSISTQALCFQLLFLCCFLFAKPGQIQRNLSTTTATIQIDVCEAQHAFVATLAQDVIKRYERRQLRACESFTNLWRVGEEKQIQTLRDRLFEAQLSRSPAQSASATVK
jgi:hypothetical protein